MNPRLRRALRLLGVILAIVVVLAAIIDQVSPGASGPLGSSYATAPQGLSGYAELLTRGGHPVSHVQTPPAHAGFDPSSTVIVLDPARIDAADVTALRRFVLQGGDLVAGGQDPGRWLSDLMSDPPSWSPGGSTVALPVLPVPQTAGVRTVLTAGQGSWSDAGASLPLAGSTDAWLLSVAHLGAGTVSLLADSSPLQNQYLARADNAALGLALAGAAGRPVAFEEAVHGYGEGNGVADLPTRWKWALIGLLVAAFVGVAARFRRLSAPDPPARRPLPPRLAHVEAVALALARTGHPGQAAGPVRDRARQQLRRRAGLDENAGPDELARAASQLGLDFKETRALTSEQLDDDDVVAAGRALVALSEAER
jgi:Domain of unknown function (DUF4350)